MNFPAALSKCDPTRVSTYSGVSNTRVSTYSCVSARPSRRTGVRGEPARKKARTKKGHGRHRFPPAKLKGGHKPVQVLFVCVKAIRFHRQSAAEPNKKVGRVPYKGHDKSGTEAVEKKSDVCRQRWLWAKAKPPMNIFQTVLLLPTAMRVFFQLLECSFWRGLWSALTNKKCLHTASSLCHAEGWQARVGMCIGRAVGVFVCRLFYRVVLLYLGFQLFGVALFVFLCCARALVSHIRLYYSNVFSFFQ
jgi:hypothetical protein